MVAIVESAVIDAPVDEVWHVLRDFNSHVAWHPAIAESRIEDGLPPDAIGAVRRFTLKDGGMLREQLLVLDDRRHELAYCLIEGPLPLFDYVATVRLRPVTDGNGTFWQWRSTFHPPRERQDEMVALVRDGIYRAGFRGLADHLEQFQQKREAVLRPELRKNKEIEHFRDSEKNGNALGARARPAIPDGQVPLPSPASASPAPMPPPALRPAAGAMREAEAIVVERHGGPEVLVPSTIGVPDPEPGEVLLRHTAIGVNFIDVYCRTGYFDLLRPPGIPGMEAAGRVEAVGAGVTALRPGERVGYACPPVGAYAAMRIMRPDLLVRLPDAIDDETAAAGLLKGMTASFLLHDVHRVEPGEVIVVHAAAGGVGSLLTQWASALGARVVATVSTEEKAAIPREGGAEVVVVRRREDFVAVVRDLTGGRGADVVFDAIGRDSFHQSVEALAQRGHLVSYGQASGPVGSWDIGAFASKSLRVSRPNYGHYTGTPDDLAAQSSRFFSALEKGLVRMAPPTRFSLSQAAQAHAQLETGATTGSLILIPAGSPPNHERL
jgi:NADPH:quinone reductase-like Zn-dependent oxidoreductase